MTKKWKYKQLKYSDIIYRLMYDCDGSDLGYVEYMLLDKDDGHMKTIPFKRVVENKYFYEYILPKETNRELYEVKLINSDLDDSGAYKPGILRGIKMLESFKVGQDMKTTQVFVKGDDVYLKDNTYFLSVQLESVDNGYGTMTPKARHYGGVGWILLPNMANKETRPSKVEFIDSCVRVLGINDGSDNQKWEIYYDNVVDILNRS